jgi:hypothetical protein
MVELKEENVLDPNALDIELIATALADQSDGEHQWLIDRTTGELVMWTSDTGIDGHNPVELDDLDPNLIAIDPIPPTSGIRKWSTSQTGSTTERWGTTVPDPGGARRVRSVQEPALPGC